MKLKRSQVNIVAILFLVASLLLLYGLLAGIPSRPAWLDDFQAQVGGPGLNEARAEAVEPDRELMEAVGGEDGLVVFRRDPRTGALTLVSGEMKEPTKKE